MTRRHVLGVVALAVAVIALAWGASAWRASRRGRDRGLTLPRAGLQIGLGSADLASALDDLSDRPIWGALGSTIDRARRAVPERGPGALGIYAAGWAVSRPGGAIEGDSAVAPTMAAGGPRVDLAAPEQSLAVIVAPRAWAAARRGVGIDAWRGRLPQGARGSILTGAGRGRERWDLDCSSPCLLDVLEGGGSGDAPPGLWGIFPDSAVALAWARLAPERVTPALADPRIEAIESLLGVPLRSELARVVSGFVVLALLEDPAPGDVPRAILAAELTRPAEALSLAERLMALGLLARSVEVTQYRGARIAAWAAASRRDLRPAVAVEGNLLIAATRGSDVRDAVDRHRLGRGSVKPPRRLDPAREASWGAWSRSSFVTTSWEEILTGRRVASLRPPVEVRATLRRTPSAWRLDGEGQPPAVTADPLVPLLRSLARAARASG